MRKDKKFYIIQGEKIAGQGKTVLYMATETSLLGIIGIADTVKKSSRSAIAKLKELGLRVVMLTGDNEKTAAAEGFFQRTRTRHQAYTR